MNTLNVRKFRRIGNRRGFVLIEALVSLLVITFGFLGLLKLETMLTQSSAEGKARGVAQHLAQEKVEQLRNVIALAADHTATTSPSCAAPAAWTGNDTITISGRQYNRTWAVTPDCTLQDNALRVNVQWDEPTGTQIIHLASRIAWMDPGDGVYNPSAAPSSVGVLAPASTAVRDDLLSDYDYDPQNHTITVPNGTVTDNNDGTWTVFKNGRYEIVIPDEDETNRARSAIYSASDFVKMSGRVLIMNQSGPTASTLCNAVLPLPSDVGYCAFPLNVQTGQPINCTATPTIKAAAYNCYVGQGWSGNLYVYDSSRSSYFNSSGTGGDQACPQNPLAHERGDNNTTWSPGARLIRVLKYDVNHNLIGQSGLLPAYQAALTNLDFIIYGSANVTNGTVNYTLPRCDPYSTAPSKNKKKVGVLETRGLPNQNGGSPISLVLTDVNNTLTLNAATFKPYDYTVAYVHTSGAVDPAQALTISGTIVLKNASTSSLQNLAISTDRGTAVCGTTYISGNQLVYSCREVVNGAGNIVVNNMATGEKACSQGVNNLGDTKLSYSLSPVNGNASMNLAVVPGATTCSAVTFP